MEFMLNRDAFMAFMFIFDAILQFRAHGRQKLRDGKDTSPFERCSRPSIETYVLSNCVDMFGHEFFLRDL
jgi:hypothetical protein